MTVLLHAYMPETTERLMRALGAGDEPAAFAIEGAAFGAGPVAASVTTLDPPLFPKP